MKEKKTELQRVLDKMEKDAKHRARFEDESRRFDTKVNHLLKKYGVRK